MKNPIDLITVEMFWRDTIPAVAPPPHKIIHDWFRWYTLDQIFAVIESERNATDYADRIGRRVSTTLRRRHGTALALMGDTTRAVHFDENGVRTSSSLPTSEQSKRTFEQGKINGRKSTEF